jgi:hypothetical protein
MKEEKKRTEVPVKPKEKDLRQIVLEWMVIDKPYWISEIMAWCPDVNNMRSSQVARLMHDLMKTGRVERGEEIGKAYFIRRA